MAEQEEAKPSFPPPRFQQHKKATKSEGVGEKTGSPPKAAHGMNHGLTRAVNGEGGPYTALSLPSYQPRLSVCLPALLTCLSPRPAYLFVCPGLYLLARLLSPGPKLLCSGFLFRQPSGSVQVRAVNKVVAININRGGTDRRPGEGHVTTNNRLPLFPATLKLALIGPLIGLLPAGAD